MCTPLSRSLPCSDRLWSFEPLALDVHLSQEVSWGRGLKEDLPRGKGRGPWDQTPETLSQDEDVWSLSMFTRDGRFPQDTGTIKVRSGALQKT